MDLVIALLDWSVKNKVTGHIEYEANVGVLCDKHICFELLQGVVKLTHTDNKINNPERYEIYFYIDNSNDLPGSPRLVKQEVLTFVTQLVDIYRKPDIKLVVHFLFNDDEDEINIE